MPLLPLASRLHSTAPFSHADAPAFGMASQTGGLAVVAASRLRVVDPPLAGRKKGELCAVYGSWAPESLLFENADTCVKCIFNRQEGRC